MSMNAVSVQVDSEELARIEANPALAEPLFQSGVASSLAAFGELSKKMEERMRTTGPQLLGQALANLDPRIREQLEQRLGGTAQQFAAGQGGDALLKVMQERRERAIQMTEASRKERPRLSLEKEWHGVHYLLCGEAESGASLLSKPVLGGKPLGDDDEGFSGYGPARCLSVKEVSEINDALSQPEVETQARSRFDADRMNKLEIYPGWRAGDAEKLMDGLRRLRAFYADAATNGTAIISCLV